MFFQIVNETYETHETLKSFSKNFVFFVSTGGYSEYFRNFASQLPDDGSGESRKYRAGHYIREKRHTMLCRMAIWNNHIRLSAKDIV